MNRRILFSLLAFLLAGRIAFAQSVDDPDVPRSGYGAFGDLNINLHSAEFKKLPGIPSCCPRYENGAGVGPTLGIFYEIPLSAKFLLNLRAGYFSNGATLSTIEETTVILGNEAATAKFEHTVDASLSSVGLEPLVGYRSTPALTFQLGGHAGYVLTKTFSQKETMIEPTDVGTFENGRRIRNDTSATIPNAASIEGAIVGGVRLTLPLNSRRTLFIEPEFLFSIGVTNVATDVSWKGNALRLGVGIKYSPLDEPVAQPPVVELTPTESAPVEPTPTEPIPPIARPELTATVGAVGVEDNGTEYPQLTLRAEEFISTSLRPLLNYVFFDENSAELPERYTRLSPDEVSTFRVEKLYNVETLPTYYNILNIVGSRLQANPSATITLVGCNADVGPEKGNTTLSNSRAEAVREYLTKVWDIPTDRIRVQSRGLPTKPSNNAEPDGIAENRRVEIVSDAWEILEPVVTSDTLRTVTPPIIRFRPNVTAQAGAGRWSIAAVSNGRALKELDGAGTVPPEVDWKIGAEPWKLDATTDRIDYTLTVTDSAGQTVRTPVRALPVEQITIQKKRRERIADKEIDRYSLILFDFDRADLNATNKRIAEFIRDRVGPTATVTITGYTDRIGEPEYNRRLSDERARTTARSLNVPVDRAKGVGESTLLYDNTLPEGRFYSRTVSVVVETPVQ